MPTLTAEQLREMERAAAGGGGRRLSPAELADMEQLAAAGVRTQPERDEAEALNAAPVARRRMVVDGRTYVQLPNGGWQLDQAARPESERGVVQGLRQLPVRAAESLAGVYDLVDAAQSKVTGTRLYGPEGIIGPRSFGEQAGDFVRDAMFEPDEFVEPEYLTPAGRRAMTLAGEAAATVPTLGIGAAPRGAVGIASRFGPRAAEAAALAGEAARGGVGGLAAEEVSSRVADTEFGREHPGLVMASALTGGVAGSNAVGPLTGIGRRMVGGLSPRAAQAHLPNSRLEFASRLGVTPLAHEGEDVLAARLARAREALGAQIASEAADPALGTATTARTLAEAGLPGAEHLERSQALAYPSLATTLGEQNLTNRGALEAIERRGGAPEVVPRAFEAGAEALAGATDEAYDAYRAIPEPPPISTKPFDDAFKTIFKDTQRGGGVLAGSAKGLDEIVGAIGPQASLDDIEAVRTRLRVELDKNSPGGVVSDAQRQRYLMQLRDGIDQAIDTAADADATGALHEARKARRLQGFLTDPEHDATRILRDKGFDVDAAMRRLQAEDPKEMARVVGTLRAIPDPALRDSALAGLEELWLRNLVGKRSLSELTPANARDLAARLRDTKNPMVIRQARIVLSGRTGGQGVAARVEQLAQVLERIPLLQSPQGESGAAYRTATGVGGDAFAEAARGGVGIGGMASKVWLRLKNAASGRIDEDLNRALTDKVFARDLLDGITADDVREWRQEAVRKAKRSVPTPIRAAGRESGRDQESK